MSVNLPVNVPVNLLSEPLDENTKDFLREADASPFNFHELSTKAAGDEKLKAAVSTAVMRQYSARQLRLLDLPDADALRTLAGQIKQHALDHLDFYLEELAENVVRN